MLEIEYLMNGHGQTKAVVIPIEIWNELLPQKDFSVNELSESLEDYCMNKAMDEGKRSPLLNRDDALRFLRA
jgi:hypothetical protein